MDNPWRDPKVLGPLAGAGLIALILAIGWAVSASHGSSARRDADDAKGKLAAAEQERDRAKHDAQAAAEYTETIKKQRDEQTAARKKAEEAVAEAEKAAKAADAARNDAEAKADRARREAEAAENERKKVAADRDHQYEKFQQVQQALDDKTKQLMELRQQIAAGETAAPKK
jgi:chromosome segregation ATPase